VADESERVAALNKEIDSLNAREGERITAFSRKNYLLSQQIRSSAGRLSRGYGVNKRRKCQHIYAIALCNNT